MASSASVTVASSIPNEDLVTQKVVNWTYTDKNTLVKIAFGAPIDADPRLSASSPLKPRRAPRALKEQAAELHPVEFAEAGTGGLPQPSDR